MDRNRHNDNLEQFFRKGLTEESHFPMEETGWDMPSDSVWDGIEEGLPAVKVVPRRQIVKYWWAAAASILFLVFCFTTFYSQRKIDSLQEQLTVQSDQLKELQNRSSNTDVPVSTKEDNTSIDIAANTTELRTPETDLQKTIGNQKQAINQSRNESKKDNLEETNNNLAIVIPPVNNGGNNVSDIGGNSSNANNTVTAPLVTNDDSREKSLQVKFATNTLADENANTVLTTVENKSISSLDLASKEQVLWNTLPLNAKEKLWSIEPVAAVKKHRWYAGVFAGPTRFNAKTKFKTGETEITKGKVTEESGIEKGFRIGWQIDKNWSLESGLSVAKNTKKVSREFSFYYDPDKESPNANGDLESTYTADLRTEYGDVAVELDFSRKPGNVVYEGEAIKLELENEVSTSFLQIPLALRYGLQKGRFNVSMSAGVLLSFLQQQKLDIPQRRPMHPRLEHKNSRLKGQQPELKEMQYAVQTGVQIAYRPSTTVEFYLSPNFSKGLSPVVDNERASTHLAQASLLAGVNVHF